MIISQIWLPTYPGKVHDLEIDVTNLEPVPLVFRFRYVISQAHGSGSDQNLAVLTDHVKLLAMQGFNDKTADWKRDGAHYLATCEREFRPRETRAHGLAVRGTIPVPPDTRSLLLHPRGVFRGYWDLSLPALPSPAVPRRLTEQLDHPARVLVAVLYHRGTSDKDAGSDTVLSLVAGQAEHLIPPDPTRLPEPGPAAPPKAAARRSTRRRA